MEYEDLIPIIGNPFGDEACGVLLFVQNDNFPQPFLYSLLIN